MNGNDPEHISEIFSAAMLNESFSCIILIKIALQNFCRSLLERIEKENKNILDSIFRVELFYAFGYDNLDAILLLEQLMDTLNWRISSNVRQMIMNGELDFSYEEFLTGKYFILVTIEMEDQLIIYYCQRLY
jgi:hypothetical protein